MEDERDAVLVPAAAGGLVTVITALFDMDTDGPTTDTDEITLPIVAWRVSRKDCQPVLPGEAVCVSDASVVWLHLPNGKFLSMKTADRVDGLSEARGRTTRFINGRRRGGAALELGAVRP